MISPNYLLDTNIFSAVMRPRPDPLVLRRLAERAGAISTGAPVVHELLFGVQRLPPSRRRRSFEQYISDVVLRLPILPYDAAATIWHAAERARLAAIGRTPPFVDGQIAAIAVTNGLTLVTLNAADYAHFDGLRLEDWWV